MTIKVVEMIDISKSLRKRKNELDESPKECNLSWIGNIIGAKDRDIEVA